MDDSKTRSSVILTSSTRIMVPIIKVVGDFCNLRCRYCFYNSKDQSTPRIMDDNLLERFLEQYMKLFTGRLIFIWHGGEPLLAGLAFFRRVVELQKRNLKNGHVIRNTIQTNATLINNEWAEFFKENDFRVGVSLDGSRKSHNLFRINKSGKGSFDQVIRGIKILRKHGIEPGIIQTLTHDNLVHARDDFDFFVDVLKVRGWGINTYLEKGNTNPAMVGQSITNEELVWFFKSYIDLWLARNDPNLQIREIENFVSGVLGKRAPNCTLNGTCTSFFSVKYDGGVYPCDRFSNQPEFLLGNLKHQSLLEILNGSARLEYADSVNSIYSDCAKCKWQKACHNGCTMHRIGGIKGKYYYCEARKEIFSYLKEKIGERAL